MVPIILGGTSKFCAGRLALTCLVGVDFSPNPAVYLSHVKPHSPVVVLSCSVRILGRGPTISQITRQVGGQVAATAGVFGIA